MSTKTKKVTTVNSRFLAYNCECRALVLVNARLNTASMKSVRCFLRNLGLGLVNSLALWVDSANVDWLFLKFYHPFYCYKPSKPWRHLSIHDDRPYLVESHDQSSTFSLKTSDSSIGKYDCLVKRYSGETVLPQGKDKDECIVLIALQLVVQRSRWRKQP